MHVLVSNMEREGWLSEQSHETCVRALVLYCGGGSTGGEEFSDLGQKYELDSDNQSLCVGVKCLERATGETAWVNLRHLGVRA